MEIIKEESLEILDSEGDIEVLHPLTNEENNEQTNQGSNSKLMNVDDGSFVDEAQLHEQDHMATLEMLSSQQHQADYKMKQKMSQKLKEATLTKLELQTSMSSSASQQLLIADASPLPAATPSTDPIAADPDHPSPELSINSQVKTEQLFDDDTPSPPQKLPVRSLLQKMKDKMAVKYRGKEEL